MEKNEKLAMYTSKARIEKSINTLFGLIDGISIDKKLNEKEISYINEWIDSNPFLINVKPFNEFFLYIKQALSDGVLTSEERADIIWMKNSITNNNIYYNSITQNLQKLHGILGGIVADKEISKDEILGLKNWLNNHQSLKTHWPYDDIYSIVLSVLKDGIIDSEEEKMLKDFFSDFVRSNDDTKGNLDVTSKYSTSIGVCSIDPEINFENSIFSVTGKFKVKSRKDVINEIEKNNGTYSDRVSSKTNYLIVGLDGNPFWSFSCYGRKIEQAIKLRKEGSPIVIVHENDFNDKILDLG